MNGKEKQKSKAFPMSTIINGIATLGVLNSYRSAAEEQLI